MGQKSANTSEIQTLNSGHFSISERMNIAGRRRYFAVPQQVLNCNEIDSGPHETSSEGMPQLGGTEYAVFQPETLHTGGQEYPLKFVNAENL